MKCPNCENIIPDSSNFCEFCGKKVVLDSKIEPDISIKSKNEATKLDVNPIEINMSEYNKKGFFNKRIGRKTYWAIYIGGLLLMAALSGLTNGDNTEVSVVFGIFYFIWLALMILTVMWRFNDLGKSKWYIFALLIPIVNIILGFGLAFEKGKLHRLLTAPKTSTNTPECPNCKRKFSQSKTDCPYCKVKLK